MSYPAVLTSSGHPGFEDLKRLSDILRPACPCELFHGSRLFLLAVVYLGLCDLKDVVWI